MIYYLIDDKKDKPISFMQCDEIMARKRNLEGYGVFYTPNTFEGQRKIENLVSINYWFIDIDDCNKEDTYKKLLSAIAIPTMIIDTKNGYHVYWKSLDATKENWDDIESRLINYFNADNAVRDIPRVLRVPSFYHMKSDPYLIEKIYDSGISYTEKKMLFSFPAIKKEGYFDVNKNTPEEILKRCSLDQLLKPREINKGERNHKIFKKSVFLKKLGFCRTQVESMILWLNDNISDPLTKKEVDAIIRRFDKWRA